MLLHKTARKEAKASGLKRYYTGLPCKRGHLSERFVSTGRCISCANIYIRKWYQDTKVIRCEKLRARRANNPAELKKHNEYNAEWRRQNPNWVNEWRAKNPEKHKAIVHTRRARKNNASGCYSDDDVKRIYKLQNGKCAYCRTLLGNKYQIDHILPLYRGGTNFPNNIQLLCKTNIGSCNQKKSAKDPVDFAQSLGLLL